MVESSNLGSNPPSSVASESSNPGKHGNPGGSCNPDPQMNTTNQVTLPTTPSDVTLEASISHCLRSMRPRIDPDVSMLGASSGILHSVSRVPYAGAMMLESWLHEPKTVARIMSSASTPRQSRNNVDAGACTRLGKNIPTINKETAADPTLPANSTILLNSTISAIALRDLLVLDIETLGLRDAAAIIIGFASFQNGDVVTDQFILADPSSENTFFTRCIDYIRFQNPKMLVTFYGSKFDVPFLMDRARFLESRAETEPSQAQPMMKSEILNNSGTSENSMKPAKPSKSSKSGKPAKPEKSEKPRSLQEDTASVFDKLCHVDLHALFKSLIPGLPKYNFQALESHFLDVNERNEDIPGAEVLPNYQAFLDASTTSAKALALARIIKHNFTDLVHSAFGFHAIVGKIVKSLKDGSISIPGPNPGDEEAMMGDSSSVTIEDARSSTDNQAQGLAVDAIEIPRTRPIMLLQGDKINAATNTVFTEETMHDIACLFDGGLDIPTAQAVLEKNNPSLHAVFDRGGWFITLERLCREGVLVRREAGDKITYSSTRSAPGLEALVNFVQAPVRTIAIPPLNTIIGNDPIPGENQPALAGNPASDPDENIFEMAGRRRSNTPVNSPANPCPPSSPGNDLGQRSDLELDLDHHENAQDQAQNLNLDRDPVPVPVLVPKPSQDNPGILSFKSIVFHNPRLQDIIRGWLATSGTLNIDDAAAALNVPRQDIMLYVFDQAGKGLINVKFKDALFWVPIPAQAISYESKAKRRTK